MEAMQRSAEAAAEAVRLDGIGESAAAVDRYSEAVFHALQALQKEKEGAQQHQHSPPLPRETRRLLARKAREYLDRATALRDAQQQQPTPRYSALTLLLSSNPPQQQQAAKAAAEEPSVAAAAAAAEEPQQLPQQQQQQQQQQGAEKRRMYPSETELEGGCSDLPGFLPHAASLAGAAPVSADPICVLLSLAVVASMERPYRTPARSGLISRSPLASSAPSELGSSGIRGRLRLGVDLASRTPRKLDVAAGAGALVLAHDETLFAALREASGVSDNDFADAFLTKSVVPLRSPGKSGARFYSTGCGRFIAKSVSAEELSRLTALLPAMHVHLSEKRPSLLVRFLAAFTLRPASASADRQQTLLVMQNLIPPEAAEHVSVRFDLKGSTHKRVADAEERRRSDCVLKDADLLATTGGVVRPNSLFKLCLEDRAILLDAIVRDARFLEHNGVMDYSLLVGIRRNAPLPSAPQPSGEYSALKMLLQTSSSSQNLLHMDFSGLRATDELGRPLPELYYLGILDFLQPYNMRKALEHALRTLALPAGEEISVCNPTAYADRFCRFFCSLLGDPPRC